MIIVSKFNENIDWVYEYPDEHIVINKGLPKYQSDFMNIENIGTNIRDIPFFIYNFYNNLPNKMIFTQGNPWDHCKRNIFDEYIKNNFFTPLESYGKIPANSWEGRTFDGMFLEINNSWYIEDTNIKYNQSCKYNSFDNFMNTYFENYIHLDWVRFSPGCQYLAMKEDVLKYPRNFWGSLMNDMNKKIPTESFVIERAMFYILSGVYSLRESFYG